jgi:hypothetical protein
MEISKVIEHIRNRDYMSGVERDKLRVKQTGEIFTRSWTAIESLEQLEKSDPEGFSDPSKTFIDPAVGDGTLIGEVLIRKLENGIDFETALSTIYGVDLMADNCKLCRERLLCGSTDPKHLEIVNRQIVCADALRYTYKFLGPGEKLYEDDEAQQKEFNEHFNTLFEPLDN